MDVPVDLCLYLLFCEAKPLCLFVSFFLSFFLFFSFSFETWRVSGPRGSLMQNLQVERVCAGDADEVVSCLRRQLKGIQQLALKQIVRAWIKGICPGKQAVFPYLTKGRRGRGILPDGVVPRWWPAVEVCRFKAPDHLRSAGQSVHHPF